MDYLIFFGNLALSMVAFFFIFLQTLISLFCSIPLTRKMSKLCKCFVDKRGIYRKITLTVLITSLLYSGFIISILIWGDKIGFFVGTGIAVLFSLGQLGMNSNNVSDYFITYKDHYAVQDLKELGIIEE